MRHPAFLAPQALLAAALAIPAHGQDKPWPVAALDWAYPRAASASPPETPPGP